jgi:cysteine-rich repeat protein
MALLLAPLFPPAAAARPSGRDEAAEQLDRLRVRARSTRLRLGEGKPTEPRQPRRGGGGPRSLSPEIQVSGGVSGTQSETSIAVFGDNVVVGYNQVNGNRRSGVSFSTNGGLTFTDTGGLPTGGGTNTLLGDPSVTACGDGKFYYSSILLPGNGSSQLAVNVGTFAGASLTWTNPKLVLSSTADFLDKEWLTCDRLTNTLYMSYTRFVNGNVGDTTEIRIEFLKSTDGGNTWSPPLVLESSTTESIQIAYVTTGPNSEVYVMWERGIDDIAAANTKLELRRSFNLGLSFDPKVVIRTMVPSFFPASVGYNREDTLEIGTIDVDRSTGPRRGALYAVWVEREAGGGTARDVFVASSTNQGASWSAPVKVNDDPAGNDQVMPWLSVNAAGTVEVAWYDYRNWRGMHTVDLYAARSADGGASFSPNFRVTTRPTSWFVVLTLTPNFGDYIGCASEGTEFYPAWADGRNNDIDVFAAHIPTGTCGNAVPDPFEECDDGNVLDGDSCSGACAVTLCGNGTVEGDEECDDASVASGDGCSQVCRLEICGDGIIQRTNKEECDDGNVAAGDGCSASCQIELDKIVWIADERSRLLLESIVTGIPMHIGDPGFHELGDLAFDASGKLFGSTGFNEAISIGYDGFLVDLAAQGLPQRGSVIGDTGWLAMNAIDFHPSSGTLYGIAVDDVGVSRLVTLNPTTGATLSVIGSLGLSNARAMAFDSAGVLYVAGRPLASGNGNLYTVNLATAARTLVGTIGAYQLAGMDFAPDGTLWGVTLRENLASDGSLVTVNKATGAGTIASSFGRLNQQGIRFAPAIAVDHDLDGIHDAADCAPLSAANPPPGLVSGLLFTGASSFTWTAAPNARLHNTYRGTIPAPLGTRLPGSVYDHVCFESGDAQHNGDLTASDPAAPPLGSAFYYVSGGEGCGDGPLDADAAHPIPNPSPCPTPP